jgi:hypothetical protein
MNKVQGSIRINPKPKVWPLIEPTDMEEPQFFTEESGE